MKDSTQTLPMSPPDYGQWLQGLSINLLVRDLAKTLHFQREVLGTTIALGILVKRRLTKKAASWLMERLFDRVGFLYYNHVTS